MHKFQVEYEDQLGRWKKEKSDMQQRIHEMQAIAEKLKFDS